MNSKGAGSMLEQIVRTTSPHSEIHDKAETLLIRLEHEAEWQR